mmetsp:Transcript_45250/g.113906  ORF Transcript_45250/g.113906 Transcript_45250/m.113906 type:complete len:418 (+) Transcript_45250:67-1320(+)
MLMSKFVQSLLPDHHRTTAITADDLTSQWTPRACTHRFYMFLVKSFDHTTGADVKDEHLSFVSADGQMLRVHVETETVPVDAASEPTVGEGLHHLVGARIMHVDHIVSATAEHRLSVAGHHRTGHLFAVHLLGFVGLLAAFQIPEANGAVHVTAHHQLIVLDVQVVAAAAAENRAQTVASTNIPDLETTIVATGDGTCRISTESSCIDLIQMTGEVVEHTSLTDTPDASAIVGAHAHHQFVVGREGHTHESLHCAVQHRSTGARTSIPQVKSLVVAGGGEEGSAKVVLYGGALATVCGEDLPGTTGYGVVLSHGAGHCTGGGGKRRSRLTGRALCTLEDFHLAFTSLHLLEETVCLVELFCLLSLHLYPACLQFLVATEGTLSLLLCAGQLQAQSTQLSLEQCQGALQVLELLSKLI